MKLSTAPHPLPPPPSFAGGLLALLAAGVVLLAGCGVLPSAPVFQQVNERVGAAVGTLTGRSPSGQAAGLDDSAVPRANERPGRSALRGNNFVGLAISGGGARAANFGAAAMEQLETLGLMQHVTVLSSVSGGGLPTGWYALHGEALTPGATGWQGLRQAMLQDFRGEWQSAVLSPHNLLATFASGLNRSDLMVKVFEDRLFRGATFGHLGAVGPRKPVVMFNATDITREGVGFAFSEQEFDRRNSRLDTFPIARAVMASGAFPGAFSPITLRNHPPLRPDGSVAEEVTYTHLMDGGPADNYGVEKLIQTARSAWERSANRGAFACLFVVIDAHVTNHARERASRRDLRSSPLDYLIDPSVFDAVDTLLVQRRGDTLRRLGVMVPGTTQDRRRELGRFHFAQAVGGPERLVHHYDRVVDFDLPVQDISPGAAAPRCRVWHVALNELHGITSGVRNDGTGVPDTSDPVLQHRAGLWEGVSRIATDYRLTGPARCEAAQLQSALYRAAEVTLREDQGALERVCAWTGQHLGNAAAAQCLAGRREPSSPRLPFDLAAGPGAQPSAVSCRSGG